LVLDRGLAIIISLFAAVSFGLMLIAALSMKETKGIVLPS
jgi:hypothetical protein